ncbi:MAG TPA: hypothetical protein VN317_03430 [Candidatus Methanoperedens sp.]|nr:hypothetical protein [Candidatus Methanoperedens sp.]
MRRAVLAATVLAALLDAGASAAAGEARRAMDEGFSHFEAQRYAEAAGSFAEAGVKAGAEGLDPSVAGFNRATALLRAGKAAEAAEALAEALSAGDRDLRESAHYQRGIALASAAESAAGAGEIGKALALFEHSLAAYEGAMRIDPRDEDPKVNHELVSRRLAQLEKQAREQPRRGGEATPSQERARQDPERGEQPARPPSAEREMRPEEARSLLDAMRQQEQSQRGRTRLSRGETVPVGRDW